MHQFTYIVQQGLMLVLVASGPPIVLSLLIGFIVAVFQATTQIQEQTLTFAPKMVVVFGVLGLAGPWIFATIHRYAFHVFDRFPALIGH